MRATATLSPIRNGKRRLLASCAITAGMVALAYGGPALAQVAGTGQAVTGPGLSIPTISPPGPGATNVDTTGTQTIIDWTPTDGLPTGGAIDFLPAGNTLNFSGSGEYTVLNRFVDGTGGSLSRQIALNGTVNSTDTATSGQRGGNIWFYNAGGILIGATGVINVGSLVLTANNIVTTGGLFGPGGTIRFNGTAGSTSAITVNGAINANKVGSPGSSYVALVAPRVVQAGTVRTDGSVAYVAAEQADIRINSGLFDINVLVGAEGGNAITHTGTTTGPAHQQGDTDQSRIYMVAIPKNDAVTMLVSGAIGYDDAISAQTDPDGAVRLSAGYNIVGGELATTPVNATAANITAGDTLFRSDTIARASGAFAAAPTQQLPASPPPLSSAGQFFVEGDGIFIGDASATLSIGIGQSGGATGTLTVQSGGSATTPGSAAINVDGGFLGVQGRTSVFAPAFFDTATGDTQGGAASLSVTGGGRVDSTAGFEVSADAYGGVDASGKASGDGRGGSATITVSGAGSVLTGGRANAHADGFGAFPSSGFDNADTGGAGIGGTATISVQNGGRLAVAGPLTAQANGQGGFGLAQAGDGTGGTALIEATGTDTILRTDSTVINATGTGGGDFYSFDPVTGTTLPSLNGGDGIGGTATLRFNANGASNIDAGDTTVNASAFGGRAGDLFVPSGENAAGGNATGGTATIETLGGTVAGMSSLTVNAVGASGGAYSDISPTTRSGDATGGTINLSVTGAGSALTFNGGNIVLDASGTATSSRQQNTGSGTGGNISVSATGGGAISGVAILAADTFGGSSSLSAPISAGSGTGGTIDILADTGGTIASEAYQARAKAGVVNTSGNNGDARGGSVTMIARSGGRIDATLNGITVLEVGAIDGVSADGSTATGGNIQLIADGGAINLTNTSFDASATSGSAGAGSASQATGGTITIRTGLDADSLITATSLFAASDGSTGADFDGFVETPGDAQGGTIIVDVQGGTLTGSSFDIRAEGVGGEGGGSTGLGGTAIFTQTGGNVSINSMRVRANGSGGSGTGGAGNGTGGTATINLLGGTMDAANLTAAAEGRGGLGAGGNDLDPLNPVAGSIGGIGRGGTATINVEGSATVNAGTITASAIAFGGVGGDFSNTSSFGGTPGTPGNGGEAIGGNATVNIRGGTTTTTDMVADASGFGGDGGNSFFSSSSGTATGVGTGGTGGAGRGGTATIALASPVAASNLINSVAQGFGGNGGSHNVGGNGGDGFGGTAQAIVTGFDVGDLSVILDASALGGDGGDANDGNGGNGGNGFGGIARAQADGTGGRVAIVDGNFLTDGVGGNGGRGRIAFGSSPPTAYSGGNGGSGTGGTIEAVASNAATLVINATNSGGIAFLDSQGRGGNGGSGASYFGGVGGDGGDGGAGIGGSVNLIASGGTIALNGNSLSVAVNGVSGNGGLGADGSGGIGAIGATSTTTGGNVLFEASNGPTSAGQIQLGVTGIAANGDTAGRVVFRGDGSIAMTDLNVLATGIAAPTNNDVDTAASGIFFAPVGNGSITTTGDMTLTTDGSVGIYAQSGGAVVAGGALTIQAGDQVHIRHDVRNGAASTVQAAGNLGITAGTSIGGAPGSLLGAGGTLSLTANGPTATIGVDRLDAANIVISSSGAASIEHAEATGGFTATAGSFRTGLNSIITGGDISITSPGAVDLGNSTAGGFVFVDGQSIAFNTIDAGTSVSLRANGFGATDGITGVNITAGSTVSLNGGGVNVSGTVDAGDSLFVTATQRDAAIGLVTAVGDVSIFAAGNLTGTYRSGGNVNLNANGNITAEADAVGGYINPVTGLVSEGYVFVDADGDAALSDSSAATMIGIRSGGAAALTGATAGEDVFVLAGTTANLSGVTAGDDIAVEAVGGITIANAQTTGAGPDGRSVVYATGSSSPVSFLQIQNTGADLSNITLLAPNAAIAAANVSAFDNLNATGGTITASGPLSAGGNIALAATGAVDLGNSTAGGFVQMQGQSIAFNNIDAGLSVNLSADGTAAGAEGISGGSITAGGDINLFANSIALTGTVTGDASFFAFGTGGAVSVNEADVDGTISIFSAADLTGTYVAGGNIFLNSNANITASAQANGGYVDGNGNVAEGNLFVIAAGNAALTDSSAARMFGVNAGLAASITGGTAGEDMLVLAGTTAGLTDITAGDDITVRAPGNITALNVRTTGAGADTHILDFTATSGSPTFTISVGEGTAGTNGADIVMASTAGAINATTLSAGDDILLNAATSIGLNGATTLGLGTTGGDSSIRTQGGATTLAGLNSFSDVVVDAAGLANLTGPVAAGRNATINAADVSLAALSAPGGGAIDTLTAAGNIVVDSGAGITGGGVRALGDVTLTAGTAIGLTTIGGVNVALTGATGVAADQLFAAGTTSLDSANGNIQLGALTSSGPITASANAIRIDGGGDMSFASLTTDVGDAVIRGGGDLSVVSGNVAGLADIRTSGESLSIINLTANRAALENTGGFMNLDTVTVAGSLSATTLSSLGISGVVTGQAISLASSNINIGSAARVGTAGTTQQLSVTNNNNDNQTFVGGTGTPSGYHLDANELTRLYGTQIAIFAPEVQAAGGTSVGSAAPPDVIVDSFTLAGGAAGSNLGANGSLTIRTPGKMRVIGNVQLTGLTDANTLNLLADDALEVILGQGTVRLVNGTAPAGQLNMVSADIIVATQAAIAAVGAATTTDAINARLRENDGVVLDEGALFARGIRANVAGGFYVQNSGAGTDFGQRRGLTFGAGGLSVQTQGPSRIVLNGVQIGANGQVTGLDVIPLLTIAPQSNGVPGTFDPRSTLNGCFIANPAACNALAFESNFPVQDVIEEETESEGEDGAKGQSLPIPLITMRDIDPLTGEPLLDDPVTGAGNDDLWTSPTGQP